jgi:hypothetical protein
MDIQPITVSAAHSDTGAPPNDLLRAFEQNQQTMAAQDLSFERQSLVIALTGANALAMIGGDGSVVLRQVQGALAGADRDVKVMGDGAVTFHVPKALNGLAAIVREFGFLAQAIVNSPSVHRNQPGPFGPRASIAAIDASLGQMSRSLGGSAFSIMV